MIVLPLRFSQMDSRWSSVLLGYNTSPQFTIYNYGCLLSCLAMALKYYGMDTDPLKLNQLLMQNNCFEPNSGIYDWGSLNRISPSISDSNTKTPNKLTDSQLGEIKSAIDANKPVILELDYNPKTVALDMHFVVAVSYNANEENDITIADPLGGTLHSLKDYLGWYKPSARDTIESYTIVSGPIPVAGSDDTMVIKKNLFPALVHGSEQWGQTVAKYIDPNADPREINFVDLQRIIGGIQSRATDFSKQLDKQKGDLAAAQQSVQGLTEQLANEEKQRQEDQHMYLAQIDGLKSSGINLDKISGSYESRIIALQSQIKGLLQDKHNLSVDNARMQAQSPQSVALHYFPTFISIMNKLFNK